MATRYVNKTRKNSDSDITALCNSSASWSPRYKSSAISDIENKIHQYKVSWGNGKVTDIHVVPSSNGKYLRTDRQLDVNKTRKNSDGDITTLCNSSASWSPRYKSSAISDIENKIHQYKVSWGNGKVTDNTTRNNLRDLPDC